MIDADSHASIYDASKLSGATVMRFRHNSPADLDKRLSRLEQTGNVLIVVEGLYSMFGDTAPLAEFVEVKKKHNAYLMVDEAHSFGVYGERGYGVTERDDVRGEVDFLVGTFSKSLGAIGGFAVSDHPQFDILRVSSRAYMFTASLSPANVASTLKALERIESDSSLRADLWRNAEALHDGLTALGLDLSAGVGPIVSVRMPDVETTVAAWNALLEAGVYVNLAIPPGTPNSAALLRCSVSAAHSLDEIDRIVDAFAMVAKHFGLGHQGIAKLAAAGE
jgi:7-keto-8-aminopelargonate synthetase-like enzyme